jgi:hypothetical protein
MVLNGKESVFIEFLVIWKVNLWKRTFARDNSILDSHKGPPRDIGGLKAEP